MRSKLLGSAADCYSQYDATVVDLGKCAPPALLAHAPAVVESDESGEGAAPRRIESFAAFLNPKEPSDVMDGGKSVEADEGGTPRRASTPAPQRPWRGRGIERLDGLRAVDEAVAELSERCSRDIMQLRPATGLTDETIADSKSLSSAMLSRGIIVREVHQNSVLNHQPTKRHLGWLQKEGAHVRTVPVVPAAMMIVDREICLLPLGSTREVEGALIVHSIGLVMMLVAHFMTVWRDGRALGPASTRDASGPSAQERQALTYWAQGLTDSMVARRLGVSERTVRRISDGLSSRLNARGRLQLGVKAMERGWLTTQDLL